MARAKSIFFSFFSICPKLFAKWNRTALYCSLAKISLIFFTEKRYPNSVMMVAWQLSTGDSLGRCTLPYNNHTVSPWREFPTDAVRVHNCVRALAKYWMSRVVVSISIAIPFLLQGTTRLSVALTWMVLSVSWGRLQWHKSCWISCLRLLKLPEGWEQTHG